jgi:hypothetical protein
MSCLYLNVLSHFKVWPLDLLLRRPVESTGNVQIQPSAIGYVVPTDRMNGRDLKISKERERKFEAAREQRKQKPAPTKRPISVGAGLSLDQAA